MKHFLIRTDGGARGNPGPAGFGVVLENAMNGEVIEQHGEFIGHATNNVAEYRGVVWGLRRAHELGATRVDVVADSELLIKQCKGLYKVKNAGLAPLYLKIKNLETLIGHVTYRHVRREYNKAADALANRAMDQGTGSMVHSF